MAVLVEGISVIMRRDAVDDHFNGGWQGFLNIIPNRTFCADDELARVGFMTPPDVGAFIEALEAGGLTIFRDGSAVDIAVVDQLSGPTTPVEWLEFAHLRIGDSENKVAVCWLFEDARRGYGVHMKSLQMTLATPDGWRYEDSLSANFTFVPKEEMDEKLKFLRHDGFNDVHLDLTTGKEVYVGTTKP